MKPPAVAERRRFLLHASVAPLSLVFAACGNKPGPLVKLQVQSDGDLQSFTPRELTCHEGIAAAAEEAGTAHGWLPRDDRRVLAATPLCGRGQVASVEFIAPEAGKYPFICTVPDHARSMWGRLHVLPRRT